MTAFEAYPGTWDDAYADARGMGYDHAEALSLVHESFGVDYSDVLSYARLSYTLRTTWESNQPAESHIVRDLLLGLAVAFGVIIALYVGANL